MDIYSEQTQNIEGPLEQEPSQTFAKTTDLFSYCLIWKGQLHKLCLKMLRRVQHTWYGKTEILQEDRANTQESSKKKKLEKEQ